MWRGGVSAPAFTSQLSAAAVRDPPHHSGPGQVAKGGYRWSPMGCRAQPEGTGGTQDNSFGTHVFMLLPSETQVLDAYMAISLLRNTDIN